MSILGNAVYAGGGGGNPTATDWKDANFIDYDGTLRYSYTAAEVQQLTSLPPNPSHDGLVAQGWNWTLADIKTQISTVGKCIIGQLYDTIDGKARIYVNLDNENILSPYMGFKANTSTTVTVDWGDGSTASTVSNVSSLSFKYASHTYATPGNYIITLSSSNSAKIRISGDSTKGSYLFVPSNSPSSYTASAPYLSAVKRIDLGSTCDIASYGVSYCRGIETVSVSSSYSVNYNAICLAANSLRAFVIPDQTTMGTYLFSGCYGLEAVSLPKSLTSIKDSTFNNAYANCAYALGTSVTLIDQKAFYYNYNLSSIVIPSAVTSIGANAFYQCNSLTSIKFLSPTPPTVSNSNAWTGIPTLCKIYVPRGYLSAYTGATNYPSSSTYTYVEY